jgi:cyclopropane-fatty-acyl-phospholipid synthase
MASPGNTLTASTARSFRPGFSVVVIYLLRRYVAAAQVGTLTVTLPSGVTLKHQGACAGPEAVLFIRRWRALWRMMLGGSIGLARAYMDDDCHSPDIRALLEFGVQNEKSLAKAAPVTRRPRIFERLRQLRRVNTRHGSRRNIAAHYDLGNAFYALWLDRGMNYSSALFTCATRTLEEAQEAKLSRIVDLLDVEPGQSILEIGCGWGPLAERLVRQGCLITGLTLSAEQLDLARVRLRRQAAPRNWDIRLQDYRDVEGRYDRIVSVEMVEAVGERYWPVYFEKLSQSLTDTGVAVLQAITIRESRFANYRRRPDFIQRYIFPGGMLPTQEIIQREAARAGLRLTVQESFGTSYAKTLAEWRRRFLCAWPEIETLGFDVRFKRMWEYYLSYCEVGFKCGAIDVSLFKLVPIPVKVGS